MQGGGGPAPDHAAEPPTARLPPGTTRPAPADDAEPDDGARGRAGNHPSISRRRHRSVRHEGPADPDERLRNCHANGRGGAFKLTRSYNAAVLNRKTLQQNLAAVIGEVNIGQPQNSPLLSKAVSVHGPLEQAPFKNRQAAAYRTLEDWVKNTLADNPQLVDQPQTRPVVPAAAVSRPRPRPRPRSAKRGRRQSTIRRLPQSRETPAPGDDRPGGAGTGGPVQPRRLQPSIPRRQIPKRPGAETVILAEVMDVTILPKLAGRDPIRRHAVLAGRRRRRRRAHPD